LAGNLANPGDAFELYVGGAGFTAAAGLTRTDALVNVQTDGLTRWGGSTTLDGAASGDVLTYANTRVFRVSLAGVPVGTVLDISLDLVGFGAAGSSARIADVSVMGNRAPVAADQNVTATEGVTLAGAVHATDADGQTLTFALVTGSAHGLLVFNADGTFTYTPARQPTLGFVATDTFTFRANDGYADSADAKVSFALTAVNDAPVVGAADLTVAEGGAVGGALTATDVDGDALTFALVTGPAHGSVTVNADGTFSYTAARQPTAGFAATDSFTVLANDGLANSAARTVNVTLTPVNDAPVLAPVPSLTVLEGATAGGTLTVTDADGDALTFTLVTGPAHGSVTVNAVGTFSYTAARQPTAGFAAADSFTVVANDGLANSAARTVSVILTAVNDAPVVTA
jgi:VCBS repeat-containing protein